MALANDGELEFYRQQCNELGKQLLHLREEQRSAHRDAQRAHLTAQLVRQTYAADEILLGQHQLAERFLEVILSTVHCDRAVLLRQEHHHQQFYVVHRLGFPTAQTDQLLTLPSLPTRLSCNSRTTLEPTIATLCAFLQLPYFLWAYEPHAKSALLLGNAHENWITPLLESKDLEICVTALEVYIHLSRRKQVEEDLRKFSLALQQSSSAVLIMNADGVIEYANTAFCHLAGLESAQHVVDKTFSSLRARYPDSGEYQVLLAAIERGLPWKGELSVVRQDKIQWEQISLTPIHDAQEKISHFLMVSEDISSRKEYEQRLFQQAHHDTLTGLPNRALAMDRLTQALAMAKREGQQVATLFLDLDKFKLINDTLGHLVGDDLLIEVAKRLKTRIRESDTLARLGGDEFLCILPRISDSSVVEIMARKLLAAFAEPFPVSAHTIHTSTSIGIAIFPTDGEDPDTLLRNTDAALYEAKDIGRNLYRFFTPRLSQIASERMELEKGLREALSRDELSLYYQPIIALASGKILGVEALLRWYNAELGWVCPDRFISVAEETGLITAIGDWVLRTACQDTLQWIRLYAHPFQVAVNVSVQQVKTNTILTSIATALQSSGLPPECLTLEITESLLLDCGPETADYFDVLRAQGVGLAIDDFGTGYSSLSYLQRHPFNKLKIDRAFTQHIGEDVKTTTLVRTILAMAHNLGLNTIAEGIETVAQYTFLKAAGCDGGQGYFFSKPLPKTQITDLLRKQYSLPLESTSTRI